METSKKQKIESSSGGIESHETKAAYTATGIRSIIWDKNSHQDDEKNDQSSSTTGFTLNFLDHTQTQVPNGPTIVPYGHFEHPETKNQFLFPWLKDTVEPSQHPEVLKKYLALKEFGLTDSDLKTVPQEKGASHPKGGSHFKGHPPRVKGFKQRDDSSSHKANRSENNRGSQNSQSKKGDGRSNNGRSNFKNDSENISGPPSRNHNRNNDYNNGDENRQHNHFNHKNHNRNNSSDSSTRKFHNNRNDNRKTFNK